MATIHPARESQKYKMNVQVNVQCTGECTGDEEFMAGTEVTGREA
jgi:hypothetical protein